MASRTVRAFLHNETDLALTLRNTEIPHGEWASWAPPGRIEPGTAVTMGSDSDGFMTGTEARATYQIGDDPSRTVYLHWDNPFSGSNSFHTNTDDAHYAFWTASGGSHAVANFVLRPAGGRATDFLPSRDGFKFENRWPEPTPYSLPPLRGSILDQKYGNAANGLCGGMVFAAMDYFLQGWAIPRDKMPPSGERDPLFPYLVDRLFDSFDPLSVSLMLKLLNPLYPDTDENVANTLGLADGRAAVMANQEWPLIRADIDAGIPSPLFLQTVKSLSPLDLGKCHQVLAYAYDAKGHDVTLHIYDPNQPLVNEVTMRFNDGDIAHRIVVEHNIEVLEDDEVNRRPIYCFARMKYFSRPVPKREGRRLTGAEIRTRGIWVATGEPRVLDKTEIDHGKGEFDVYPDCGEHEFKWVITAEHQEARVSVVHHGYRDPVIEWNVNGVPVPAGGPHKLSIPKAVTLPSSKPVGRLDPTWTGIVAGRVEVAARIEGATLVLENRPDDANYTVTAYATCREPDEPVSSRMGAEITFLGHRETVVGYEEAIASCFKALLQRTQQQSPELAAVVEAMRSQLGRPPDPIWDPDPVMAEAILAVAAADPMLDTVHQWEREAAAERPNLEETLKDDLRQHLDVTSLNTRIAELERFGVPKDLGGGFG